MEFRILGPLDVRDGSRPLALGGEKQRAVLAILLLRRNQVVSADRLIDELWGESPPPGARRTLRAYVSKLRRAMAPSGAAAAIGSDSKRNPGDGVLLTRGHGYVLEIAPGELDLHAFERLVREGRQAAETGNPCQAALLLREADSLWRGRPLADLEFEPFARVEVRRLEDLRLAALEDRIDADLALGRHAMLCPELEALAAEHPLRERLHAQLMLALYRSGRQAEALDVYQRTRAQLSDELGLEPGHHLRSLQARILSQDPSLTPTEWPPVENADTGDERIAAAELARASQHQPTARTEVLIGRDREIEDVAGLLADEDVALVTLTGTGGAGKSALALCLAREVGPSFDDGVTVVWLAETSGPAQVVPELARQLGIEVGGTESIGDAIVAVLRFQHKLLVLDNFEHVLAAGPALVELISRCSRLKVLVTSRAPLRVSLERVYNVGGLAVPSADELDSLGVLAGSPAAALFVDRAVAADPNFELTSDSVEATAELCRYLGGLPLALELAAARTGVLTPAQILGRLRTGSDPLGPARRDAPDRHRTLQATIGWSFDLLMPREQRLFTVLGLFVGGFSVDAVEAICGETTHDVVGGLATLLDHGLVQRVSARSGPRLGTLEPVRQYALRRLRSEGSYGSVVSRYVEYYGTFAESARASLCGDGQLECLERLDDELGNLRNVLELAQAQPRLDLAFRVTAALSSFWITRDLGPEIRAWLRRALEQPASGDRAVRAWALYTLGSLALIDWDQAEAMTMLIACLAECSELGDMTLTAYCEAELADAYSRPGDANASAQHAERALAIVADTGDPWTKASVLKIAGSAAETYDLTRDRCERALALYSSFGDRLWSSFIKGNLGYAAVVEGDYDYARLLTEQAIAEGQGIWGVGQKAQLEANLGLVALFQGEPSRAGRHLRRSLAHSRRIGWWANAQEAVLGLAVLAASEGRDDLARTLASAARAVYDSPSENTLQRRLYGRLPGSTSDANHEPALTAHQLDGILREASKAHMADQTVAIQ
jgi:predicted ATPase/DNA-binding SARP family transcriptional activator/Tfp pilus assembly protein PilF